MWGLEWQVGVRAGWRLGRWWGAAAAWRYSLQFLGPHTRPIVANKYASNTTKGTQDPGSQARKIGVCEAAGRCNFGQF